MDHYSKEAYSAATSGAGTPMRPMTPDNGHHQEDNISSAPRAANPFASPFVSRPPSTRASSSAVDIHQQTLNQKYFHSRRVRKGEVERPWLDKKDPREKWVTIIPIIGVFLGLALSGFLVYDGLKTVVNHTYCQVLDEDWSGGIDPKVWTKEAEVGGFG